MCATKNKGRKHFQATLSKYDNEQQVLRIKAVVLCFRNNNAVPSMHQRRLWATRTSHGACAG
jgi:hypothetical protein